MGLIEIWCTEGTDWQECRWGESLARMRYATVAVNGFGASDCACRSHLFRFPRRLGSRTHGLGQTTVATGRGRRDDYAVLCVDGLQVIGTSGPFATATAVSAPGQYVIVPSAFQMKFIVMVPAMGSTMG